MSGTRTVYRVEDEALEGPYAGGDYEEAQQELVDYLNCYHGGWEDTTHPSPSTDGLGVWWETGNDPVFGFASREQAAAWWVEEIAEREGSSLPEWLDEVGFGLSAYEVPEELVRDGRSQVVFDRSKAKPVGRTDVASLTTSVLV